jgi:4a-hydroxytetrahydrobiopterin dehydratase
MTETLASKTCTPCRGGIPPLTREQAEVFHAQAPDWQLPEEVNRIERSFRFRNFREALTFVQEIGELAEAEGHHPNISFGWGNATVSLQTKKIKDCMRTTSSWPPRLTAYSPGPPRREPVLIPAATCAGFSVPSTLAD